jgi:hypothetical protein
MKWPSCVFLCALILGISSCGIFMSDSDVAKIELKKTIILADKCPCMLK